MLPFLLSSFSPPPPHLVKTSHSSFNRYISCAKSDSRGFRNEMEDACISKIQLMNGLAFFSVMDGHGGSKTSRLLSKLLPGIFVSPPKSECGTSSKLLLDLKDEEAIQSAYLQLDKKICKALKNRDISGSTCVSLCVLYKGDILDRKQVSSGANCGSNSSNVSSVSRIVNTPSNGNRLNSVNGLSGVTDLPTSSNIPLKRISSSKKNSPKTKTDNSCFPPSKRMDSPNNSNQKSEITNGSERKLVSTRALKRLKELSIEVDNDIGAPTPVVIDSAHTVNKTLKYQLVCLNVGDSRCILYFKKRTFALSSDHKPTNSKEKARIIKAGYDVSMGRVDGMLAVSRAFGDEQFKQVKQLPRAKQAVVATPDIITKEIEITEDQREYSFAVLACDGIYDCMTNEDVTRFIIDRMIKYDIWNDDFTVNHLNYVNKGWYYTRIQDWTTKMVSEFKDTLSPGLQDLFPHKKSLNGVDLITWLNIERRKSKGTPEKLKKLYKYVSFTEEKINRFLDRPPARTTAEKLQVIAENLIDECILQRGSQDNCTVSIVLFHHPSWISSQIIRAKEARQSNNQQVATPMNYSDLMSSSKLNTPSSHNMMMSPKNRIRHFEKKERKDKETKSPYSS